MGFQTQLDDDRIVVTVDVGVDTVEALEDLANEGGEGFWERDTWGRISQRSSDTRWGFEV